MHSTTEASNLGGDPASHVPLFVDLDLEPDPAVDQRRMTRFCRAVRRRWRWLDDYCRWVEMPRGKLSVARQLVARPSFPAELWTEFGFPIDQIRLVLEVIQEASEWPNYHLIPNDPLELALLPGAYDFWFDEIPYDLRDRLGIRIGLKELDDLAMANPTVGDFVTAILLHGDRPRAMNPHGPAMYCIDCSCELRGLTSRQCPECGREFDTTDPTSYGSHPVSPGMNRLRGLMAVGMFSTAAALAVVAAAMSSSGSGPTRTAPVVVAATCVLLLTGSLWAALSRQMQKRLFRWFLVSAAAFWAAGASVPVTQWPLRLVFAVYGRQLDHIAQRVQTGQTTGPHLTLGPITIRKAEVNRAGAICLWTNLNPAGHTGLMKCSPALIAKQQPLFWSTTRLGDHWYLVEMD